MNHRSEEQLAAIHRFETDYFPTLEKGIVSKDITQAMRQDWAILLAPPEIPLAVSVTPDKGPHNFQHAAEFPIDVEEEAKLEAAVELVGIREPKRSDPPPTPKVGKGRRNA